MGKIVLTGFEGGEISIPVEAIRGRYGRERLERLVPGIGSKPARRLAGRIKAGELDHLLSAPQHEAPVRPRAVYAEPDPYVPPPPSVDIVGVTALDEYAVDVQEVRRRSASMFTKKERLYQRKAAQRITFDRGPVMIAFAGDQHIGNAGTNVERMYAERDMVLRTPGAYLFMMGDLVDNFIVGRLIAQNIKPSLAIVEQWAIAEDYIQGCGNRLVGAVAGNHDCLDEETELLTRRGWIRYTDIQEGDEVLSINPETEKSEWSGIDRVHVHHDVSYLCYLRNNHVDMAVTHDHRVLHRKRGHNGWGDLEFAKAADLTTGRIGLPVSAESAETRGVNLTADEIYLAGLVITDGYLKGESGIQISQRKSNADKIASVLRRAGVRYSVRIRHREVAPINGVAVAESEPEATISILQPSARRFRERVVPRKDRFPDWAWSLTDDQFRHLLRGLIEGDGTDCTSSNRECYAFYNRKPLVDELQALCIQHGYSASIYEYTDRVGRPQYRLNITRREISQIDVAGKWDRRVYGGSVWCLTVPHGNFAVRRGGRAYFTGNCWSKMLSGVDHMAHITPQGILYDPDMIQTEVRVGRYVYRMIARHKWKNTSQYNITHGQEYGAKFKYPDYHIYVGAHTHPGAAYREFIHNSSRRVALHVGPYKIYDDYQRQENFNPNDCTTMVCLILDEFGGYMGGTSIETCCDYMRKVYPAAA